MKKILILLSFLLSFFFCFSQTVPFPINQGQGSSNTLVTNNGGFRPTIGFINTVYADTATANLNPFIKYYAGAQIRTITPTNSYWLRSADATAWLLMPVGSSGTNIYNSDGVLTSSRTLTGNNGAFDLYFDSVALFNVNSYGGGKRGFLSISPSASSLEFSGTSDLSSFIASDGLIQVGVGLSKVSVTNDSIRHEYLVAPSSSSLTGYNLQMRSTVSGALVDYTGTIQPSGSYVTALTGDGTATGPGSVPFTLATVNGNIGTFTNATVTTNAKGLITAISTGSSSASSLQAVTNVGNTTDTAIIDAATLSYSTYGSVFSDNFARASFGSNYITSGAGATYTFPGSAYLNITGTANVQTNFFARTDSTNENKGAISTRVVINTKAANSYGFYIGWGNLNTLCCNHQVMGGVSLTTGTNNLFFVVEAAGSVFTDAVALTIASGDTIDLTLSQADWSYTLTYFNHTTDVTRTFSLTGFPAGSILPLTPNGFSRPEFHHLGGDMRVYSFSRVSNESKNARNVVIGNSLTLGGNITDPSQRYPVLMFNGNPANVIISAGGGSVATYSNLTWTGDLSRYAAGAAENFWVMGGGNDSLFSVWEPSGKAAMIALRDRVVAAGKRFIWMTPMPRNALALGSVADTIVANAIRLGDPYVDFFHRFAVSTNQLPSNFNAGDGTHLTVAANRAMAAYVDSLYPQYTGDTYTGDVTGYRLNGQYVSLTGLKEFNYTAAVLSVNVPRDVREVKINPSSALATLTVTLPYDVPVGTEIIISFGGIITAGPVVTSFTLSSDASQTVTKAGFLTPQSTNYSFGAGDMIYCRYQSTGQWIANPMQTYQNTTLYVQGHTFGSGPTNIQSVLNAGYFAGNQATTPANNTNVGNQAGQVGSTATGRTNIGSRANLSGNTSNVTWVGYSAGENGGGNNSTGVGYANGFNANSSSTGGAYFAYQAGFDVTSGINNVLIGGNTGRGITTGAGNAVFGNDIIGLAAAQSGTLILGANGLRRIWANSSGRVTIGGSITNTDTANADATLRVNGNFAIRTVAAGTSTDSVLHMEDGLVKSLNIATALGISSGTYTPTLTNGANVAASTASVCQYLRVGNTVTVSGKFAIDPTLTATQTILGFSLPIASAITADGEVGGAGSCPTITAYSVAIKGDAANDRATVEFISSDINNNEIWFSFTYLISS